MQDGLDDVDADFLVSRQGQDLLKQPHILKVEENIIQWGFVCHVCLDVSYWNE